VRILKAPVRWVGSKFEAGSFPSSVFNAMASTLGTGILTLPYAVNLSGLWLGVFNILLGLVLAIYSTMLIVVTGEKTKCYLYEGIGYKSHGNCMGKFAEINMIVNNFAFVIAYIVLLKELIPHAFDIVGIENGFCQS